MNKWNDTDGQNFNYDNKRMQSDQQNATRFADPLMRGVGKDVIYSALAWSCAEDAYPVMKALAKKHNVGFFDASGPDAEIILPDGAAMKQGDN